LSVSPSTIAPGGSATLAWTVANATTITIDNGIGTVTSPGQQTVSPAATTTYTLTATNANGSTNANAVLTVGGVVPPSPTCGTTGCLQGVGVVH
jgi:hypothetical protein